MAAMERTNSTSSDRKGLDTISTVTPQDAPWRFTASIAPQSRVTDRDFMKTGIETLRKISIKKNRRLCTLTRNWWLIDREGGRRSPFHPRVWIGNRESSFWQCHLYQTDKEEIRSYSQKLDCYGYGLGTKKKVYATSSIYNLYITSSWRNLKYCIAHCIRLLRLRRLSWKTGDGYRKWEPGEYKNQLGHSVKSIDV